MCKIILKFGEPLTATELAGHRESCEKGAGLVWYDRGRFNIAKDLLHRKAYQKYVTNYIETDRKGYAPWTLFHSRMPSAGTVNYQNAQPFISDDIAFCHNGTLDVEDLLWRNASAGTKFDGSESDSLLLFKLLRRIPIDSARAVLRASRLQNFILASLKRREVYIIGSYEIEANKDTTHILSARNKWAHDRVECVTDFEGKCLSYTRLETRIEPKVVVQRDLPQWWNKV